MSESLQERCAAALGWVRVPRPEHWNCPGSFGWAVKDVVKCESCDGLPEYGKATDEGSACTTPLIWRFGLGLEVERMQTAMIGDERVAFEWRAYRRLGGVLQQGPWMVAPLEAVAEWVATFGKEAAGG